MKTFLLTISILLTAAISTNAAVLTFDDIGTTTGVPIPNGYGGFSWSKSFDEGFFYYENISIRYRPPGGSGLFNGVVSGDCVALPTPYSPEGKGWVSAPTPFIFTGAYFTAVWRDALNVQVDGYLNDALIYSKTVVVNTTGPTWFEFNYANIDLLKFSASGGTQHQGYQYDNTEFVMDNFTYTPEPISFALFGLGALVLRNRK
jgi:hypothetical protein